MNIKYRSKSEKVFQMFNYLFLILFSLICLYPMLYVLFASLSEYSQLMSYEGLLLKPLGFNLAAYTSVMRNPMIISGYKNTIIILLLGVAINMVLTILGSYFLSRKNVYFKNSIMILILITMYFSGGLIPSYLTVKSLGIDNTLWAVILPSAISTFNMIIMKSGFEAVPASLEEAAKIDGAGHINALVSITLPLVKPMLAVICLYYAVANWNSWFSASIYLNDRTKFPLQLILREILITNDTKSMTTDVAAGDVEQVAKTIQYATIIIATLPILVVYPFLQKYFEKGVLIGSIKG